MNDETGEVDFSGVDIQTGEMPGVFSHEPGERADSELDDVPAKQLTNEEFVNWMRWLTRTYYFTVEEFERVTDENQKIYNSAWHQEFWALWVWFLDINQTKVGSDLAYWHDGLGRVMQRMSTWAARKQKANESENWNVE